MFCIFGIRKERAQELRGEAQAIFSEDRSGSRWNSGVVERFRMARGTIQFVPKQIAAIDVASERRGAEK